MNRYSIVISILTAVLIALAINIGITIRNADHINHEVSIVCSEHRELARIAKEEAEEGASQQSVTARINIPGLSHTELVELTNKKQIKKVTRAAELQLISRQTC